MQAVRLRRLRRSNAIRNWISQTQLQSKNIILPYFVVEGRGVKREIKAMPEVYHLSIDNLLKDITQTQKLGIESILLFGIPRYKDKLGSQAYRNNGVVQRAIKAIKKKYKDLIVITDVCLCGYTSHGHCGVISQKSPPEAVKSKDYIVDNDKTLRMLAKIALSHARAGADFVAPSAMMDGQVRAIREVLDKNGFRDVGILAYSAKYASNFYSPFREALDSSPRFGDRRIYQMDYRNSDEALREIGQDIDEGADIVMIKPALPYLDIIYRAKQRFNIPIAAYNVSGEYAMVKAYCQRTEDRVQPAPARGPRGGPGKTGVEEKLVLEILTAIKRAGADLIITYWAKDVVKWLKH